MRIAMTATTTSSSISVNPGRRGGGPRRCVMDHLLGAARPWGPMSSGGDADGGVARGQAAEKLGRRELMLISPSFLRKQKPASSARPRQAGGRLRLAGAGQAG